MHTVLLFAQVAGHGNQGLDAEDAARVLIVLGQLSEDGQKLLDHVLLFQLSREFAQFGGTYTSDHWRVLLTQLHELLSEALFLGI